MNSTPLDVHLPSLVGSHFSSCFFALVGPPAVGKETVGIRIAESLNLRRFVMSDALRKAAENNPRLAQNLELAREGKLLPAEYSTNVALHFIRNLKNGQSAIADGCFRQLEECRIINTLSIQFRRPVIIFMDLPAEELHRRMINRAKTDPKRSHELDSAVREKRIEEFTHARTTVEHIRANNLADVIDVSIQVGDTPDTVYSTLHYVLDYYLQRCDGDAKHQPLLGRIQRSVTMAA